MSKTILTIDDSASIRQVVDGLKDIYERAGDTSTFQNAVFKALSRHKTLPAYELLRTLLIQDPPIFDNGSDYNFMFQNMRDSLALIARVAAAFSARSNIAAGQGLSAIRRRSEARRSHSSARERVVLSER